MGSIDVEGMLCPTPHALQTPTDNSEDLCAKLLGQPLPDPLPKTIEEFETFLQSGQVPVFDLMYRNLTSTFPSLVEKLMDMGTDYSMLVSHFSTTINGSLLSSFSPGGLQELYLCFGGVD